MDLAPPSPMLMYILAVGSLVMFTYGFYIRVKVYGVNGFINQFKYFSRNYIKFLRDALLQGRVLNDPYIGISHLLIMYGFLILLFGKVVLGFPFLFNLNLLLVLIFKDSYFRYSSLIMDISGFLFIVGVCLALVRRVVIKPWKLETGLEDIVALIALLYLGLSGLLTESFKLVFSSSSSIWSPIGSIISLPLATIPTNIAVALHILFWWSHILAACIIVAAIPYSKLWHILAVPGNIAIQSDKPLGSLTTPFLLSELLSNPEAMENIQFGVGNVWGLDWPRRFMVDSCTNCGRCDEVCPAVASKRALKPRMIIQKLKKQLISGGVETLIDSIISEDEVWSCTTCGKCMITCPAWIGHVDFIVDLRRWLVGNSRLDKKKSDLLSNLAHSSNSLGMSQWDRQELAAKLDVKTIQESSSIEYLLWIGCLASYDSRAIKISESLINILKSANISFAVLGAEETCCGDPARRLGEESRFQEIALNNIELFKKYGVKKILTLCPHCYNTLKNEYPKLGLLNIDVYHYSELIENLISRGVIKLSKPVNTVVVLHDPCYLARYNNIYSQPRVILKQIPGLKIREARNRGRKTFCCGGGGANYWYEIPEEKRISVVRLEELTSLNVEGVITECPFCLAMLEDAARIKGIDEKISICDLTELISKSLNGV
jgi:Fe-S oxidoreductase/nitrate reductase gamma subunit